VARIVIADDGIEFDGRHAAEAAIGGAEGAVAGLAEALAARGHDVSVHNRCAGRLDFRGVAWRPLEEGLPDAADLYIANRAWTLIDLLPTAKRRAFWLHNPARYVLKWRYLRRLWRRRPVLVFAGPTHAAGYPAWAPGERLEIPLGVADAFRHRAATGRAPRPRALFASNPLRSLDWVLDVWAERIRPRVAAAELHVFAGAAHYGATGAAKGSAMQPILDKAAALASAGVVLRRPVRHAELAAALVEARLLLYRGDAGETFCLAAAEAQAMGVPLVTEGLGSLRERLRDGETGFVAMGQAAFAEAAIRLLQDDELWLRHHRAALTTQRGLAWEEVAGIWENGFLL
jgi:hypothetical protein